MTWQWVVLIAIVAVWTLGTQLIHAWREIKNVEAIPEDVRREIAEGSKE